MKKFRKALIITLVLLTICSGLGYLIYDQLDAYAAYPNEPISIKSVSKGFSIRNEKTSVNVEFASTVIRYRGAMVTGAQEEGEPIFYWYVKQGAHIIQEMPADGVVRQSNRARTGKYTLTIGESTAVSSPSLAQEGRAIVGSVDYSEAFWPRWPFGRTAEERQKNLETMGMYRVDAEG